MEEERAYNEHLGAIGALPVASTSGMVPIIHRTRTLSSPVPPPAGLAVAMHGAPNAKKMTVTPPGPAAPSARR